MELMSLINRLTTNELMELKKVINIILERRNASTSGVKCNNCGSIYFEVEAISQSPYNESTCKICKCKNCNNAFMIIEDKEGNIKIKEIPEMEDNTLWR